MTFLIILRAIAFGVSGFFYVTAGLTIKTWQFWALLACMLTIQVTSQIIGENTK